MNQQLLLTALFLAWAMCPGVFERLDAAEEPAYGAADFVPSPKRPINFRGDPRGGYPGAVIPTDFSAEKNLAWKAEVGEGCASPLIVGQRIFVQAAPNALVCLDAAGGKILWQRAINHLEQAIADAAERAKVAKDWHDHVVWNRTVLAMDYPKVNISVGSPMLQSGPKIQRNKEMQRASLTIPKGSIFPQYNLDLDLSQYGGGNRCGDAFPTPCSDGKRVFVVTGWRQCACFDLEGNQRWLRWIPEAATDDYHVAGGWRSPVAWNGVFVADLHGFIRAFDAETGATRWEVSRAALGLKTARGLSPKIFRVGDQDLLWCAGPVVVRLKDGKPLKLEGWANSGAMVAVNSDSPDTLYFAGGGQFGEWTEKGVGKEPAPAAVKFALTGDTLRGTVLWSGLEGVPSASDQAVIAYDQGKVLFFNWISYLDEHRAGVVLDASSGKLVGGNVNGEMAVPPVCQAFAVTGSNIYGIGTGGPFGCDTHFDAKKVMVEMAVVDRTAQVKSRGKANTLMGPDITAEHEAMVMSTGRPWLFSPWLPFTLGSNRIYVRSNFQLICIGETKGGN